MTKPIYAIGDIHGQLNELHRIMALIEADGGRDAQIVFLGDYTDRGADSKGVIDLLIEGRDAGRDWTFLKGNHDNMFWLFMQTPIQMDPILVTELFWLHKRLGGDTTMESYGVDADNKRRLIDIHTDALAAVPAPHVDFLAELQTSHQTEKLFFAHAGVRPGVALDAQTDDDLMWIRKEFHAETAMFPKLVVHGHTPVDVPTHYGNRVNLDTGAGYGKPLSAAVFEGDKVFTLSADGRKALEPTATA